jgi:hypothetical protein
MWRWQMTCSHCIVSPSSILRLLIFHFVFLMVSLLLTLPEHLDSLLVFSGVRVTRSSVLCVRFVDRCLSFCTFSFCHCVVCSSQIYGFWLPLWCLQSLLSLHFSAIAVVLIGNNWGTCEQVKCTAGYKGEVKKIKRCF